MSVAQPSGEPSGRVLSVRLGGACEAVLVRNAADLASVGPYKPAIIFEHIDPAHVTP